MILRGRATPLEEGDFNFEISGEFVTVSELLSTQLFLRVSEQGVVLWRGGFISRRVFPWKALLCPGRVLFPNFC